MGATILNVQQNKIGGGLIFVFPSQWHGWTWSSKFVVSLIASELTVLCVIIIYRQACCTLLVHSVLCRLHGYHPYEEK
jgi:hypothetical protein